MRISMFAISILFLASLLLIQGCASYTCKEPYIPAGEGCCLDANSNGWCDSDEQVAAEEEKPAPVGTKDIEYAVDALQTLTETHSLLKKYNEERKRYAEQRTDGWERFGGHKECTRFVPYEGRLNRIYSSIIARETTLVHIEIMHEQLRSAMENYFSQYYRYCKARSRQEEYVYITSAEQHKTEALQIIKKLSEEIFRTGLVSNSDARALMNLQLQAIDAQRDVEQYKKPIIR